MNVVLTLQDIKKRYPDEWLLIGEPELDASYHLIAGEVLAHSPSRDVIYAQLIKARGKSVTIEHTGPVPADLAVIL